MPNTKGRRRRFGAVRELPSGQWQARYQGPDGIMRPADRTFPTKTDAERWLTRKETEILDGDWTPMRAECSLGSRREPGLTNGPEFGPRRSSCTATCYAATWSSFSVPRPSLISGNRTCAAGASSCSMLRSARSPLPRHTGCSKL